MEFTLYSLGEYSATKLVDTWAEFNKAKQGKSSRGISTMHTLCSTKTRIRAIHVYHSNVRYISHSTMYRWCKASNTHSTIYMYETGVYNYMESFYNNYT